MPVDVSHEAVHVLLELPREPGLADPGNAEYRDEPRLALVGGRVEEILDQTQLAVTADKRWLESIPPALPTSGGSHPERPPERKWLGLALELVFARVLVLDRRLAGASCPFPDEDGARPGRCLDARRRVHEVTGHHALALGPHGHRRLTGHDAHAHGDAWLERCHYLDELERCSDGALGIVLAGDRRAPDGHHGIADELLDSAAVAFDHLPRCVKVAREEIAHLLGVAVLGERSEADQVAEEHGYQPPFGHRPGDRIRRRRDSERGTAVTAEPIDRLICGAASRTGARERGTTVRAEHPPDPVLGSTCWTGHASVVSLLRKSRRLCGVSAGALGQRQVTASSSARRRRGRRARSTRLRTTSIVNAAGSSDSFTSSQRSGVDTGAPSFGRTEYDRGDRLALAVLVRVDQHAASASPSSTRSSRGRGASRRARPRRSPRTARVSS